MQLVGGFSLSVRLKFLFLRVHLWCFCFSQRAYFKGYLVGVLCNKYCGQKLSAHASLSKRHCAITSPLDNTFHRPKVSFLFPNYMIHLEIQVGFNA